MMAITSDLPAPPSGKKLSEFLRLCMELGVRAPADKEGLILPINFGQPWDQKEFAHSLGKSTKQVSNYLKDKHPPGSTVDFERIFFGPNQRHLSLWRRELRAAHRRTKDEWAKARENSKANLIGSPDKRPPENKSAPEVQIRNRSNSMLHTLRTKGPTIIGAIGIAQGLAHLIWTLTEVLQGNPENLWQIHWTYADLGFGLGGVVIGFACILNLRWARNGGIVFCITALFSAYLWFADESNADAERLLWAANYFNPPVSFAALCYFLFGWPDEIPVGSASTGAAA
jgi:hypothetical protein